MIYSIVNQFFNIYSIVLIIYVLSSWFPNFRDTPVGVFLAQSFRTVFERVSPLHSTDRRDDRHLPHRGAFCSAFRRIGRIYDYRLGAIICDVKRKYFYAFSSGRTPFCGTFFGLCASRIRQKSICCHPFFGSEGAVYSDIGCQKGAGLFFSVWMAGIRKQSESAL